MFRHQGEIVIGVDGGDASVGVLQRAFQEAELRSRTLDIVHVYESSPRVIADDLAGLSSSGTLDDPTRSATERQSSARRRAVVHVERLLKVIELPPDVHYTVTVVPDENPAAYLIQRSVEAEMLILGSRGLGGFKGLLLGSVSLQVSQHANCPVLIYPNTMDDRTRATS